MVRLIVSPDPQASAHWLRRLDPTTLVGNIAAWSAINAISFFASNDLQSRPLMAMIARQHISNNGWGCIMLLDASLLGASLFKKAPLSFRSAAALLSAAFWIYFGSQLVVAGTLYGSYPTSGLWDLLCGAACGIATAQWAMNEGGVL